MPVRHECVQTLAKATVDLLSKIYYPNWSVLVGMGNGLELDLTIEVK